MKLSKHSRETIVTIYANPELRIKGALITMMDKHPLFSHDSVNRLRENYGAYIETFDTETPTSIRMTESSSNGKSIFQ